MILRTVLCPVDFSEQSQQALRWAGALAARQHSRLVVLTSVDPLLAHAAKTRLGLDLAKTETEPELRAFVREVLPDDDPWAPHASIDVGTGQAADVILQAADKVAADLIVIGTHGLGGFRKVLLGSTTEQVLRRTSRPLLAVPLSEAHAITIDAGGPRFDVHNIMAATDFSGPSLGALGWAADLATDFNVPLLVTHVVPALAVAPRWRSHAVDVDEEQVRVARTKLESVLEETLGSKRRETIVTSGRPAEAIASMADERGSGLIVMGLTGQGEAIRPGSIAYRVLTLAGVAVLVVPATAAPAAVTPPAAG